MCYAKAKNNGKRTGISPKICLKRKTVIVAFL